ncbi:hypothetical protein Kisp01_50340 [Kineosporia sp. NBRC 101677]|uniref:hypothetical protein n=1 Tax=Kineosporia sp. NBRC 101677 TaxID=3032197 RepID=UPI0024A193FD|nr:hypothetical protein [Kineosporia sp. NBRC 101677]GLY18020.1 hypothetical protein Kisp01_50340 [Kineosporia sp. NBRC 101677]
MTDFNAVQPAPEHLRAARAALEGALLDDTMNTYDFAALSEALGELTELYPFQTPNPDPESRRTFRAGLTEALAALASAAEAAKTPGERIRIGLIRRGLHDALACHRP